MFDERYPEPDPNKRPQSEIWNERYKNDAFLFGREPIITLKTFVSVLRPGRALDIAMGEGRNSVFMAKQGLQVEGLDVSSVAVEKAKRLAQENQVSIEAKTQNLDFFLMPLMKYDTIIMTYFHPVTRFFNEIRRGLVLGGTCLLEAYTVEHYKQHGSKHPALEFEECYKPNEMLHLLKDFQILYYKEMNEGDQFLVQAIAKKAKP